MNIFKFSLTLLSIIVYLRYKIIIRMITKFNNKEKSVEILQVFVLMQYFIL